MLEKETLQDVYYLVGLSGKNQINFNDNIPGDNVGTCYTHMHTHARTHTHTYIGQLSIWDSSEIG